MSSKLAHTQRTGFGEWWITILRPTTLRDPNRLNDGSTTLADSSVLFLRSPYFPLRSPTSYWSLVPVPDSGLVDLSMLNGL